MGNLEIDWTGPYGWPGFEHDNNLPCLPRQRGVYLQTFSYQDGYIVYLAGITRRSMAERFREHTRSYFQGKYNVLDIDAAQNGARKEIWHGWGYARAHRDEFEKQKDCILEAVRKQLAGFRLFTADLGTQSRILERVEAAIMKHLYRQPAPFSDLPDRKMFLARSRPSDVPIALSNRCTSLLHGLPALLQI
jgi:hypothetical protein